MRGYFKCNSESVTHVTFVVTHVTSNFTPSNLRWVIWLHQLTVEHLLDIGNSTENAFNENAPDV